MKIFISSLLVFTWSSLFTEKAGEETTSQPEFTLVWSDEFDGDGLPDENNWAFQTQWIIPGVGWANNEQQHYTDRIDNAKVENGVLKIIAKKETFTDSQGTKEYTSARLTSKYDFTYGKVVVRAKLPNGVGSWPAIWTLGTNIDELGGYWNDGIDQVPWPFCGEIDIMEQFGQATAKGTVHATVHHGQEFGGTSNTSSTGLATATTEFHDYAIIWTEEEIQFLVDDQVYYTYNPETKYPAIGRNGNTWPFDQPQYILLNVAMGGTLGGSIDPNFTESAMEVDYVRVYEETVPQAQEARLKDLKIDQETVDGFNINRFDYSVLVPSDVTEVPTVSFELNSELAEVEVDEATTIPGTTTVTVTSQDASDVNVYRINFKRAVSVPLAFETDGSYDFVNFGGGFASIVDNPDPDLLNTSGKVIQTTKSPGETFGGVSLPLDFPVDFGAGSIIKVKVNAPRAGVPLTFKLESPTGSNEKILSNSKSNEWEVFGFDFAGLDKDDYNAITLIWDNGTMGDGSANWTFLVDEIEVVNAISDDATLSDLKIDGTTIAGFSVAQLGYTLQLDPSVTTVPDVSITTSSTKALTQVTEATSIPGTTTILVVAEDGDARSEYSVRFSYDAPLGVEEAFLTLYPNPVTHQLRLPLKETDGVDLEHLRILDVSGRMHPVVFRGDGEGLTADVSGLAAGVYLLSLDLDGQETLRFVKR